MSNNALLLSPSTNAKTWTPLGIWKCSHYVVATTAHSRSVWSNANSEVESLGNWKLRPQVNKNVHENRWRTHASEVMTSEKLGNSLKNPQASMALPRNRDVRNLRQLFNGEMMTNHGISRSSIVANCDPMAQSWLLLLVWSFPLSPTVFIVAQVANHHLLFSHGPIEIVGHSSQLVHRPGRWVSVWWILILTERLVIWRNSHHLHS